MSRAQKLSSKYLDIALQTIPVPPDYTTLGKKDRRKYSHLHNLVNKVHPLQLAHVLQRSNRSYWIDVRSLCTKYR